LVFTDVMKLMILAPAALMPMSLMHPSKSPSRVVSTHRCSFHFAWKASSTHSTMAAILRRRKADTMLG